MAADEKKTLTDAKLILDPLKGLARMTDAQIKSVEDDFKDKKVTLANIEGFIAVLRKNVPVYRNYLVDAEAEIKNLRKFNSAQAAAMAKDLESARTLGAKTMDGFEKNIGVLEKVWAKCCEAEKGLHQSLVKCTEWAENGLKSMSQYAAGLPDKIKALQAELRKNAAGPQLKRLIDGLNKDVKECGVQITTAESVVSSIEGALKGRDAAYSGKVIQLADSADKLKDQLSKYTVVARALIAKARVEINKAAAVPA